MGDLYEKNDKNAATENSSAAFNGWVNKLRFDKSFTAKLILSDDKVKEYYADIATELLKYEKVRSKTGWSGVTFSAGRERIASVALVGKTLCLYLAVNPETLGDGKYKVRDVKSVKKREKTPSLLRVKSDGGKRYAITVINKLASELNLALKRDRVTPIEPSHFKTDSFNNLITRGLIRILRYGDAERAFANYAETAAQAATATAEELPDGTNKADNAKTSGLNAFDDAAVTIDELFSRHGVYNEILSAFSEGECKASFSEKLMLRAIDEIWVRAIEDCVNSIDELIRNPNHFIAETEEVLPIELTKKISGRSVAHLCRHTDYLSSDDKGNITPAKMLNVFRNDSIMTYENKFLNTLINRLYAFVGTRYAIMKDRGADERLQVLEVENDFPFGEGKAKIKISVEYSDRSNVSTDKKALAGSGLWARAERIYGIVTGYVNSAFVKEMDKNFIHPPIMRTNAILKNKYFRECLALWEFIESYDDSGYGIVVDEKNRNISPEVAKELYKNAAMLYFNFKRGIDERYGDESEREYDVSPEVRLPNEAVPELYREELEKENVLEKTAALDVSLALLVALAADDCFGNKMPVYRKSFVERLCDSDIAVKNAFARICNDLLLYKGVKLRYSRKCATLRFGRVPLAAISVAGKSLKAYFAIDLCDLSEKYYAKSAAEIKRYSETPSFIKVRSPRSVKYATEIINLLAEKFGLEFSRKPVAAINADKLNYEYFGLKRPPDEFNDIKAEIKDSETVDGVFSESDGTGSFAISEIPFGYDRNAVIEKNKEAVENLAVKESARPTAEEKSPAIENADDIKDSDRMENIKRVNSNYVNPMNYGLDDSSGFISDEKQAKKADERHHKNVYVKRKRRR